MSIQPLPQNVKPLSRTKLHLTPEKIKLWSNRLRNELCPLLAEAVDPSEILTQLVCDEVNKFFNALISITPTVVLLQDTKIHLALQTIVDPASGWPVGMAERAEQLLAKWEKEVEEVVRSRDVLWSQDGALAGCTEVRTPGGKTGWVVEMADGKSPSAALTTGDQGVQVGTWWINRAAALRDGMISSLEKDITFDRKGAYAIVITGAREKGGSNRDPNVFWYDRTGVEGVLRILGRMTSPPNRMRVLREMGSTSSFAPRVGIRFEGLFRVANFSTKLERNPNGSSKWIFIVRFERESLSSDDDVDEDRGPLRLVRPNADDLAVWQRFIAEREDHIKDLKDVKGLDNEGVFVSWKGGNGKGIRFGDSVL